MENIEEQFNQLKTDLVALKGEETELNKDKFKHAAGCNHKDDTDRMKIESNGNQYIFRCTICSTVFSMERFDNSQLVTSIDTLFSLLNQVHMIDDGDTDEMVDLKSSLYKINGIIGEYLIKHGWRHQVKEPANQLILSSLANSSDTPSDFNPVLAEGIQSLGQLYTKTSSSLYDKTYKDPTE